MGGGEAQFHGGGVTTGIVRLQRLPRRYVADREFADIALGLEVACVPNFADDACWRKPDLSIVLMHVRL
jgi:hypothetical protein